VYSVFFQSLYLLLCCSRHDRFNKWNQSNYTVFMNNLCAAVIKHINTARNFGVMCKVFNDKCLVIIVYREWQMISWLWFVFKFAANYNIRTKISEEYRCWMRSSFLLDKESRHLGDSCSEFRENNILFSEERTHVAKVRWRRVVEERKLRAHRWKYLNRQGIWV